MTTDQSKTLMTITKKMADELQEYVSQDEEAGYHPSSAEDTLQQWNDFCLEMPCE
ncbi:MAG: hypothetical protein KZQ84_10715 [Candidatus Thiodiazotropha sp. (ex Lucinoma borealis)]|nr:hypothetical protein [Candidatus Thiodiazotropha sp. (ex Lucinoma borealis)]